METAQKGTKLTKPQQDYITYCALGTYWPKDAPEPIVIDSVSEYCRVSGLSRRTAYNYEFQVAGFWDMVEEQRKLQLNRKLTEYYKWAEISARPLTKRVKNETGKGFRLELVRAGSAEHLKILLGQSGRQAATRQDHTTNGKDIVIPILGGASALSGDDSDQEAS